MASNAILAASDPVNQQRIQLKIKHKITCKGDDTYMIMNLKDNSVAFSADLALPTCGDAKIPFHDAAKNPVITPIVHKCGCYLDWEVKDGKDATIGHVKEPTCAQKCHAQYCPWFDSVFLRACDAEDKKDVFTLRRPGLGCCGTQCGECDCSKCGESCNAQCCEFHCRGCFMLCKCKCTEMDFKMPIYSGDMSKKEPVAWVHWQGTRNSCDCKVMPGYTFTVLCPAGCTFNDAALLVLMAIFLDSVILRRQQKHLPCSGYGGEE